MTIYDLAVLIVARYSHASPGSESAQSAIEREADRLRETITRGEDGNFYVLVEVDGD